MASRRGHRLSERGDQVLDPGLDRGDVGVERVDPGQHLAQQERVVVGEPAEERLLQVADLGTHPGPGHLRQHRRVTFAGDQGGHHRPTRDPEDVRGHDRELDLGIGQQLLHPVLLPGPLTDQVDPVAGHVPQLADRGRRHETRADHAPLGDLAQPDSVDLVRLRPARQVLDVPGVDQPHLEPVRLQQVERRPPVIRGGLHDHPGDVQLPEPVGQQLQRPRHRGVGRHLLRALATRARHPGAAHHLGLADIQRSDPRDDLGFVLRLLQHRNPPPRLADQTGPVTRGNRKGRCEAESRARSDKEGPTARLPAPD